MIANGWYEEKFQRLILFELYYQQNARDLSALLPSKSGKDLTIRNLEHTPVFSLNTKLVYQKV